MTITHFSNAQIFDGESPDLKTDCYLEVSDNKITYIGKEKPEWLCHVNLTGGDLPLVSFLSASVCRNYIPLGHCLNSKFPKGVS